MLVLLSLLVLSSIYIALCFHVHHFIHCPVLPSPCQHSIVDPSSPKALIQCFVGTVSMGTHLQLYNGSQERIRIFFTEMCF